MYRTSGIVVLMLGGLLTSSLILTPFHTEARRWVRTEDGDRVKARVWCPDPYSMLFDDAVNPDISIYENENNCLKTSRRLFTGGVAVALVSIGLGIRGLLRGPRPPLEHLRPISEIIEERQPG